MKARYALGVLIVAAGCASPAARIKNDRIAFDSFPPQVQKDIRKGEVDVGFTPEQAYLAKGRPESQASVPSASGDLNVWNYEDYPPGYPVSYADSFYPRIYGYGVSQTYPDALYMNGTYMGWPETFPDTPSYEQLVFERGRVIQIKRTP